MPCVHMHVGTGFLRRIKERMSHHPCVHPAYTYTPILSLMGVRHSLGTRLVADLGNLLMRDLLMRDLLILCVTVEGREGENDRYRESNESIVLGLYVCMYGATIHDMHASCVHPTPGPCSPIKSAVRAKDGVTTNFDDLKKRPANGCVC